MEIIKIECNQIKDWDSFHQCFKNAFGYPEFYGKNMNAWIDCMTNLDEEFSKTKIEPGKTLTLSLQNVKPFKKRCPDIYDALIECAAFVNWRRINVGHDPVLLLSFYE